MMYMTQQEPNQLAYSVEESASSLGVDEFSLLSRIQAGEINSIRARSGEIKIPESELERLAPGSQRGPAQEIAPWPNLPDRRLGIESRLGLRRHGVRPTLYRVPGHQRFLTEGEIEGYRAAYGAVAKEVAEVEDFKKQLGIERQFPQSDKMEIDTAQTGHWEIREALLNLKRSEVVLCQRGNEFAVIERFDAASPYAQTNGPAQILLQGNNAGELKSEFQANARHTLAFMASNATAKAQGIVWGYFHEHKPELVMEAISERCQQAAANQESNSRKITQSINRGIRV
jgi:hypothetical protein